MNDFDDLPPLFDPGQDLYEALRPADADVNAHYRRFSRYNPAVKKAFARFMSVLRRFSL
jgi:hypothetical protein